MCAYMVKSSFKKEVVINLNVKIVVTFEGVEKREH